MAWCPIIKSGSGDGGLHNAPNSQFVRPIALMLRRMKTRRSVCWGLCIEIFVHLVIYYAIYLKL